MLNEFPKTFGFVFVDDVDPSANWLLDAGPVFCQLVAFVLFLEGSHFIGPVEDDGDLGVWEVHVAVSLGMIDP